MPFSQSSQISSIVKFIEDSDPASMLDVGTGMGQYGYLARNSLEQANLFQVDGAHGSQKPKSEWRVRIDGIEGCPTYLTPVHDYVYNRIMVGEALGKLREIDDDAYDLVLAIDILEHFTKPDGLAFLAELKRVARQAVLVSTPKEFHSQEIEANPYENHRSHWTDEELKQEGYGETLTNLESWIAICRKRPDAVTDQMSDALTQTDGGFTITLDYPVNATPRYPIGEKPHARLNALLSRNQTRYQALLESFLSYSDALSAIPLANETSNTSPYWINGFLPGLDAVAIYCLIAMKRPEYYFEIGSGNSTKFARQAIRDHRLSTRIVSIDPGPRAEINEICDEVLRLPLENCDPNIFDRLNDGDILFVDNSHRCFMNSDVTTFFLDILPNLKENVTVGIHDIALPYDYPAEWSTRYYSEQYLLACWLLAETNKFDVLLPSLYASLNKPLAAVLDGLWNRLPAGIERHGSAFWLQTRG